MKTGLLFSLICCLCAGFAAPCLAATEDLKEEAFLAQYNDPHQQVWTAAARTWLRLNDEWSLGIKALGDLMLMSSMHDMHDEAGHDHYGSSGTDMQDMDMGSMDAMDAMDGKGVIKILLEDHPQFVYLDVRDTGKGIPKSRFKTVFRPGFTTKKRGWGLGLSLSKRIIEGYHKGRIFVKNSAPGEGTTFKIILKKS